MSDVLAKGQAFIKEVTARLKGDVEGVIAAKNARKAISAVDSQLASLKSAIVDAETAIEDAVENLGNAKYPTVLITNNREYIEGIKNAQEKLDEAKDFLASLNDSVAYFEDLLSTY